jgi:anti-anti-sigma regulatory factor
MASVEPNGTAPSERRVRVVSVDGERAQLALSGEVTGKAALEIEECLVEPVLQGVQEWVLDLSQVTELDTACAFALMRPLMTTYPPATVHIRGASREVHQALHRTGAESFLVFDP